MSNLDFNALVVGNMDCAAIRASKVQKTTLRFCETGLKPGFCVIITQGDYEKAFSLTQEDLTPSDLIHNAIARG